MTGLAHEALFYRDPHRYRTAIRDFVQDGLAAAEPVLIAVPARKVQILRHGRWPGQREVRLVEMDRVGRNPGRIIPFVLLAFVAEHPGRAVRIVGEPIWPGRTPTEYPACMQHEALINVALADASVRLLCPYDASRLHPAVLADAERTHPVLIRGNSREASARYTDPDDVVRMFNKPFPEPVAPPVTAVFHADGLAHVRNLAAEHARRAGLDDDRIVGFQLAVNELATNVLQHTDGPGQMRVWTDNGRVICEISDSGQFMDRLAGRRSPSPDSKRGRGLLLVNYLCDLVQTYTQATGTTIRMHMETGRR